MHRLEHYWDTLELFMAAAPSCRSSSELARELPELEPEPEQPA